MPLENLQTQPPPLVWCKYCGCNVAEFGRLCGSCRMLVDRAEDAERMAAGRDDLHDAFEAAEQEADTFAQLVFEAQDWLESINQELMHEGRERLRALMLRIEDAQYKRQQRTG